MPDDAHGSLETGLNVGKVEHETLDDRVYKELKTAIMSGAIVPGTSITIRNLARALGTSAMPARDALRRLVAERVLEKRPNRTIGLPVMTPERFDEIRRIRVVLDALAAEAAADHISPSELDKMARLESEMAKPSDREPAKFLPKNREFHFTIYRASRMPVLISMIETLWLQIGPLLNYMLTDDSVKCIHRHHVELLDALKKRDGIAARTAMGTDIYDAGEVILGVILKNFTHMR